MVASLRRKLVEVWVSVVLVVVMHCSAIVDIDKNDKLDMLIVENLSIVSGGKQGGGDKGGGGEEVCVLKELLITSNIIIQKLCEIEAKVDAIKVETLKGHSSHLHTSQSGLFDLSNMSNLAAAQRHRYLDDLLPPDTDTRLLHAGPLLKSPLITKCIDKKKEAGEIKRLMNHLNGLDPPPPSLTSKFDERMKSFQPQPYNPSILLRGKMNHFKHNRVHSTSKTLGNILSIGKHKTITKVTGDATSDPCLKLSQIS